jgi:hypothetical protein
MEHKRVFNTKTYKWEDVRVYTEEDLLEAFDAGESFGSLPFSSITTSNRLCKKEWFEKFKNKNYEIY